MLWLLVLVAVGILAPAALAERPFTARFSANDTGEIAVVGNTLMTCPASDPLCATVQAGGGTGAQTSNNAYNMAFVDVDGAATTFNSSTARVDLPTGATVLFAGLYWGGRTTAGSGGSAAPTPAARGTVLFAPPGGAYQTLTGSVDDSTVIAGSYGGFANVTDQVAAAGSGVYSVGNVQAGTGIDRYAGWSLVVVYRDTSEPPRNLTVFDGLQAISQGDPPVSIPLSGFQTPATGPVLTTAGFVGYEGDRSASGDRVSLNDVDMFDAANPVSNFFNSTIGGPLAVPFSAKTPDYRNQLGFDADLVAADGILPNSATSAVIRLRTTGEQYVSQVATLSTELYAPRLVATKSVVDLNGPPTRRGDTLRYSATFTNSGEDGATQIVATDRIPTGTTFVPDSISVDGAPQTDAAGNDPAEFDGANGRVVFRLGAGANATQGGSLALGESATFTFDVTVNDDVPPGAEIANVATADYFAQTSGAAFQAESPPATVVVAEPDLTLTKTHEGELVGGATTPFTITVSNAGAAPTAGAVTVTDTFPTAVFNAITVTSATGWDCSVTGTTLSCTRSDALPGGDAYPPIVVNATLVPAPPATDAANTAIVAGGGDANEVNNGATDVGLVTTRADVQIEKVASRQTVFAGESVDFTLTVRNAGPSAATGVLVTDSLPADFANTSVTTSLGSCTTEVTCDLGEMDPGDVAIITVSAAPTGIGLGTNTATATTASVDPTPGNNSAEATFEVVESADLSLTKNITDPAPPELPTAGESLTYTLTVDNAGPSDATAATVVDPLPAGFTPTTITPTGGFTCNTPGPGGTLTCSGGSIATGGSATITVVGTLGPSTAGRVIGNSARVDAGEADPDTSNNSGSASSLVIPAADLELSKTGPAAPIRVGDTATFALHLVNRGPSDATGVTISDALPSGLEFVSVTGGCTHAAGTVSCTVGTLAADASHDTSITVRATRGGTLRNTATASGDQPDPVGANNDGSAEVTVEQQPSPPAEQPSAPPGAGADLAIEKTASHRGTALGRVLTYTLTVTNRGPADATGVRVTDTLPKRVDLLSASASQGKCGRGRPLACMLGQISAGAQATIRARVRPESTGRLVNTAAVTSNVADPVPGNNEDAARTRIAVGRTGISLSKTPSTRAVRSNRRIGYRITLRSKGPATAYDLRVCDRLPSTLMQVRAPGARFRGGRPCWTIGELPRGGRRTFQLSARAVAAGGSVTNTVTASGQNVAGRSARATVRVLPARPGPCPSGAPPARTAFATGLSWEPFRDARGGVLAHAAC
jgi:uncharacterized repeat protein (TIGR01451 family)